LVFLILVFYKPVQPHSRTGHDPLLPPSVKIVHEYAFTQ
jgi:hypothetical protein